MASSITQLHLISIKKKGIIVVIYILVLFITIAHASRAYSQGCSGMPPAYYDYENFPFPPPNVPARSHDDFSLLRRLGAGKFSDVFEAVERKQINDNPYSSDVSSGYTNKGDNDCTNAEITPLSLCVIKCLKPVSEKKIKRELLVLSHASELPNLARLRAVVLPESFHQRNDQSLSNNMYYKMEKKQDEGQMPSLVLEHAGPTSRWFSHGPGCDHNTLPSYLDDKQLHQMKNNEQPYHLTEYEIKYYLFHLLVALDCLHSRGIMHRDVKPRNVLINRRWPSPEEEEEEGRGGLYLGSDDPIPLMLIDLGLADFYMPNQRFNVRVASRHYKAPELLLGNEFYDYGVDMWGVGCILAGLLLRREPMFRGKDNIDQLGQIVSILGKEHLLKYCDKYGIQLSLEIQRVVQKYTLKTNPTGLRRSWLTLLGSSPIHPFRPKKSNDPPCPVPSRDGLNLLDKLLVYDHGERLTAKEAMMHPFFDSVRDKVTIEVQNRWLLEHNEVDQ